MLEEFKKFITRGNVIDLAVGVIIGAAFQKIVSSLVEDIITPLISILTGKVNFTDLTFTIGNAVITYGNFITAIIDFLIMAFVIFIIIKYMNKMNEKLHNLSSTVTKKGKKGEESTTVDPVVKLCPFCCSEINFKATKCPHCTSSLEETTNKN